MNGERLDWRKLLSCHFFGTEPGPCQR